MKKYKLIKDIPGHRAGEIFSAADNGSMYDSAGIITYTAEELRRYPDIMDWFEAVEDRWPPKDGDYYWFVTSEGDVAQANWIGTQADRKRLGIGNCFRTKGEADAYAEWLEATALLRADAADQNIAWDSIYDMFVVCYSHSVKKLVARALDSSQYNPFVFDNREDAERSIAEHEAEWLAFLGVE